MGLVILLALGLLLAWALMVGYTAWVLSHPARRTYGFAVARNLPGDPSEVSVGEPPVRGLSYTSWTFRSRGMDLPVWDVRGLDAAGPTIVFTHGWGDSRIMVLPRVAAMATMASRLIVWDIPAHGDAPKGGGGGGFTLGAREHEDLLALMERVSGSTSPVVLFGSSLGAGVSIVAAATQPNSVRAVIAEAPYRVPAVPARNVLCVRGMPFRTNLRPAMAVLGLRFGRGLSWAFSANAGGFDRALHAARLPATIPLLVLHGSADPVCPVEDGRAIADAAPNARLVAVEGGGHNNLWTDPAFAGQCVSAVREFLETTRSSVSQPFHPPHSATVKP